MTFEIDKLGQTMRNAAKLIGLQFRQPDDDWTTVLMVMGANGRIFPIGIEPAAMEHKEMLFGEILPDALRKLGATAYGMIASTWALELETDEEFQAYQRHTGPLSEYPGAYEQLTLTLVDRTKAEVWTARIDRHEKKPPTLQSWQPQEVDEISGLMQDALATAIRPQG